MVVVQGFLGCDVGAAMKVVHDLYEARLRQFDDVVAVDLPEVSDELGLGADQRELVARWVEALRDWLAGNERWALESGRYTGLTPREAAVAEHLTAARPGWARRPPGCSASPERSEGAGRERRAPPTPPRSLSATSSSGRPRRGDGAAPA